jgi:hypothetical protein
MSLVPAQVVGDKLGKPDLTDDERDALQPIIQYEAEVIPGIGQRVNLIGPIRKIISVTDDNMLPVAWSRAMEPWLRDSIWLRTVGNDTAFVTVTYDAGSKTAVGAAYDLIRDVVTRNNLVSVAVASGAINTLTVEGTTIGYGAAVTRSDSEAHGPFTATELRSVARLRRRVAR